MISLLIFSVLLLLYFYLGFIFWKHKNIKKFFFCTVLLPLTPALTPLHTQFQIVVYYAFIATPLLLFLLASLNGRKLKKSTIVAVLILPSFFIFYLVLGFFLNSDGITLINILKDAKPIFFLVVGFFFLDIFKGRQIDWNSDFCKKILLLNFITTLFFFLVFNYTNVISVVSNDPFYLKSQARYLSLGTFYALFFLFAKMGSGSRITFLQYVLIFIPILLSGNRTFLLVIAILFMINAFLSMANPYAFLKKIGVLLIGLIGLGIGVFRMSEEVRARVMTLFDLELLLTELTEKRFSPFIIKLESFSWYNYIIGKGVGETFFIPWFVYRENIKDYNIYMDNIYLTLYVKYGLGLLILLYFVFYFINQTVTNQRFKILVIIYFLIIGFTGSFMYQSSFLFIVLLLVGFKLSENHRKSSPNNAT